MTSSENFWNYQKQKEWCFKLSNWLRLIMINFVLHWGIGISALLHHSDRYEDTYHTRVAVSCAFISAVASVTAASDAQSSPSVVVKDYQVTPAVLTAGEKGTLTVTLQSVSPGTRTSSVTSGGDTASTTSPVILFIESVTFKSKDFELLKLHWFYLLGEYRTWSACSGHLLCPGSAEDRCLLSRGLDSGSWRTEPEVPGPGECRNPDPGPADTLYHPGELVSWHGQTGVEDPGCPDDPKRRFQSGG